MLQRSHMILSLCLMLAACQSPMGQPISAVRQSETGTMAVTSPKAEPPRYQAKVVPFAVLEPFKSEKGEQKLRVRITYPNPQTFRTQAFHTQAFGCGEVAAASIQVTGPGLSTPIYADGSNVITHQVAANNCNITATLSAVPFGDLIVMIRLYDATGNFLTGSELKGALRLNSGSQNLELSYRQMAAANLLEKLRQGTIEDKFLAGQIDLAALQTLMDNVMQVGGTFPNYTFVHHPSLVNLPALIADLKANQGNPALLNPANPMYIWTSGSARLVLNGYLLTQPVDISIDDTLSPNVQVNANGQILIANVPPGTWQVRLSGAGYLSKRVAVTVTENTQTDLGNVSIYPPQPTLTSLNPTTGVAGSSTVLTGTNFNANALTNNQVKFGTTPATVTAATPTSLTVTVPNGLSLGLQPVTLTIGASDPTTSVDYAVLRPHITSLVPAFGQIGSSVVINGNNFNPTLANNLVKFGSTTATLTAATSTQLTVTVPNGLEGQLPVTVQNLSSPFSDPASYDVTPTLTSAAPNTGSLNDVIVLTGQGFSSTLANNTVKFGTTTATVTAASNTSLTVSVPDTVAGTQNITVKVGNQTSASTGFTVIPKLSALSTIDTIGGKAALIRGQTLTLTGQHFDPNPANNIVNFGLITAPAATVNAGGTQLTVIVPASVDVPGDVIVNVVSNSQTSNSLTTAVPGVNVTVNGGFK